MSSGLERAAYHEAGHAVAGFIKRRCVRKASIIADGDVPLEEGKA